MGFDRFALGLSVSWKRCSLQVGGTTVPLPKFNDRNLFSLV